MTTFESQLEERLEELDKMIDDSRTKKQKKWRTIIYNRVVDAIDAGNTQDEVIDNLWGDYLAWCAVFLTTISGHPLMLTPWQYKLHVMYEANDDVWAYLPRRNGKTTGLASLLLYDAMTRKNAQILLLAPTSDQLVVMKEIRNFIAKPSAAILFEKFVGHGSKGSSSASNATDKLGSTFNVNTLRFLNGSIIEAHNLNVKQGGSTKRGLSADTIVVDEISLLPAELFHEIVESIIMDSHTSTRKKLVRIGTPDEDADADLKRKWHEAIESDDIATLTTNAWEAVENGLRMPKAMRKRFMGLGIQCPYVRDCGACPIVIPEYYEELTGKPSPVEGDQCPCNADSNKTYVQEDMARFFDNANFMLNEAWIDAAGITNGFRMPETLDPKQQYIISVDVGQEHAETWIGVWELTAMTVHGDVMPSIKLVYKEVIIDQKIAGVKNPSMRRIRELYNIIKPVRIYIDSTGKKEIVVDLVMHDANSTAPAIPMGVFVTNKTAENNGTIGQWSTGPYKAEMMNNMIDCFRNGQIMVPKDDTMFWSQFTKELKGLRPQPPTNTRPYVVWPDTLHMTDAVALAALHIRMDAMYRNPYTSPIIMSNHEIFSDDESFI